MRICLVHSYYKSPSSGENLAVSAQGKLLAESGHEVQIVASYSAKDAAPPRKKIRHGLDVATGLGESPEHAISLFRPDIVHIHNLFPNWSSRWLKTLRVPFVASIHNFRPVCAAGTLSLDGQECRRCPELGSLHAVRNRCYGASALATIPLALATAAPKRNPVIRFAGALIFLSEKSRQTYREVLPETQRTNGFVVPNFAPSEGLRGHLGSKAKFPRQWCLLGRISREKGVLELLKDWPKGEPLTVVGGGPDLGAAIEMAAGKSVSFVGDMSNEKAMEILSQSLGLVFPSPLHEHSPLVVLEALSHGVPIVARSGSVGADLALEAQAGQIYSTGLQLREALAKTKGLRGTLSANALSYYFGKLGKKIWLKKIENIYSHISQRGPIPGPGHAQA